MSVRGHLSNRNSISTTVATERTDTQGPRGGSRSVRFVVIEGGASALEAHAPPDGGHQTVVIAQGARERPLALALRAARRVLALEQARRRVESMVVLLGPRLDAEATAARLLLAQALSAHSSVTNGGTSELLLSTPSAPSEDVKAGLITLVDTLKRDPDGWSLPIRVQFPEPGRTAQCPGGVAPSAL